jgi:4-hydroxy-2-oxoheptanedioate aldolase
MADETLARHYLGLGFTFVAVGTDVGLMVKGTDDLVKKYKGEPTAEADAVAKAPNVY